MILGVDVGVSGAVAILDGSKLITVFDMPTMTMTISGKKKKRIDARALHDLLADVDVEHAFIEIVNARPNQGVSSMFAFGQASGIAEGICATVTPNVTGVRPQKWKKHFNLGSEKTASRALASQIWTDMRDKFKRVKDDGRAEAALIGLWGYESVLGGERHETKDVS